MSALTWRRGGDGETSYISTDGRYTINHEDGYTMCEAPHPDRSAPGGYCYGGEDHLYRFWQLDGRNGKIDAGSTLQQMKDSAEYDAARTVA